MRSLSAASISKQAGADILKVHAKKWVQARRLSQRTSAGQSLTSRSKTSIPENFLKDSFAFHHGLGSLSSDVAKSQYGSAVADNGYQVPLAVYWRAVASSSAISKQA